MDALTRGRELLEEIEEFITVEIDGRVCMIQTLKTAAAALAAAQEKAAAGTLERPEEQLALLRSSITLDGTVYGNAALPIGVLRQEIGRKLSDPYAEVSKCRQLDAVHVRSGLFTANRFLTSCLDAIKGYPGGIKLRSAYLGKMDVAHAWLLEMNAVIADLIVEIGMLIDTHDTIPAPPPKSGQE
ncbi:MAG: hypothetical protein AAB974_01540 [Patescibacteria group bacterium]